MILSSYGYNFLSLDIQSVGHFFHVYNSILFIPEVCKTTLCVCPASWIIH